MNYLQRVRTQSFSDLASVSPQNYVEDVVTERSWQIYISGKTNA